MSLQKNKNKQTNKKQNTWIQKTRNEGRNYNTWEATLKSEFYDEI